MNTVLISTGNISGTDTIFKRFTETSCCPVSIYHFKYPSTDIITNQQINFKTWMRYTMMVEQLSWWRNLNWKIWMNPNSFHLPVIQFPAGNKWNHFIFQNAYLSETRIEYTFLNNIEELHHMSAQCNRSPHNDLDLIEHFALYLKFLTIMNYFDFQNWQFYLYFDD